MTQSQVLVTEFHVYGALQAHEPLVQAKFGADKQLIIVPVVEHAAPFKPSFIYWKEFIFKMFYSFYFKYLNIITAY